MLFVISKLCACSRISERMGGMSVFLNMRLNILGWSKGSRATDHTRRGSSRSKSRGDDTGGSISAIWALVGVLIRGFIDRWWVS